MISGACAEADKQFLWRLVIGFGSFCASMRKVRGSYGRHQAPVVLTSVFKIPDFRQLDGEAMRTHGLLTRR
ncbi:hypothetical protein N9V90_01820 [Endozoicomonas sp.]|nr:hypothetical protein [Endozoicomonas sp.]